MATENCSTKYLLSKFDDFHNSTVFPVYSIYVYFCLLEIIKIIYFETIIWLNVYIKAQSFQIYIHCMYLLLLVSLNLQFYEQKHDNGQNDNKK